MYLFVDKLEQEWTKKCYTMPVLAGETNCSSFLDFTVVAILRVVSSIDFTNMKIIIPPANFVCRGYTVFTLSVRASVRPSVRPGVRPSVRNALFP